MAPPEAARPPAQGKTPPRASLEEAPGGAPLAALVAALLALVAAHKATCTHGAALALLTALEALGRRSEQLLRDLASKPGPSARTVPVAHVDGPVIGLSFWATDTLFEANPFPEERDPKLAQLADSLETVLVHHQEETMSPAVDAVLSAIWSVLGVASWYNSSPGTRIEFETDKLTPSKLVTVRLVDPAKPAPLALSLAHALMVTDIRCALESITEILETLALARSEFEQEKHLPHVSNGLYALGEVQRLTWVLSGEVRSVSATLTGVDVSTSVGVHISALGRLGGYDADPWTREHELRSARESFERAGEGAA